jgi:flagellar biogenesis protein FliO
MAMQLSIDEEVRRQHQCGGQEGKQGAAVARLIAIFEVLRRAAVHAFARIKSARERGSKRKQMRLVESLTLGGRRQLLLIVCNDEKYLVGVGADSVGSILAIEATQVSRDRTPRGLELVRRRGRDACRETRPKIATESGLDL